MAEHANNATTQSTQDRQTGPFAEALQSLESIVLDGLKHGHFHCDISASIGKNKTRELLIISGKSHKFVIPLTELPD